MRKLILAGCFTLLSVQAAQAALFDDNEARKQIQELAQKTDSQNQATQASLEALKKSQQALEQRVANIEAMIKSQGLMDLLSQIDRLNQDLNVVKGQLEVANHNIEMTQQRQKDLYADVDGRVRKLESNPASTSASPDVATTSAAAVAPEATPESKDFDSAQSLLKTGKFKESFDAFDKFLQTYPKSAHVAEAYYGLGMSQFSLRNYKASIATQQKVIAQFPESDKLPDAYYSIANSQIQLADVDGAKKSLKELLAKFPNSEVAPNAKKRLAVLESIKK